MKRCPECRRDYYDDTLLYCLDDGNALLEGPASFRSAEIDAKTAILPSFYSASDLRTQHFPIFGVYSSPPNNTIAVLPFLNLNPDTESDYFSDGLSEELINVLSKIPRLRVAARTSAFSFKQKQSTVAEIGHILNVASVLEGSVRKAGERIRISVQLVKVEDGYHLWSETYDRTMDDIFAVQDDIAQCVVKELQGLLLGREAEVKLSEKVKFEVAEAIKGRSSDPEAQRLMLLGRYFLDRTTQPDSEKAVAYFRQALEIDPAFALGWTELGMAYSVQSGRGWRLASEGFELAREAAHRALELEPELAEAHALIGRIKAAYDRNIPEAEQCYRRALELAPGSSSVLDGVCILTYKMGRFDEAIELAHKVLEKDPLASAFWHNLGLVCHASGRLDEAEAAYRRAIDLAPHRFGSPSMLALVLLDAGKSEEAIEQLNAEPDEFWRLWGKAILDSKLGKTEDARAIAAKLEGEYSAGNEYQIAEVYAEINDTDKAFEWLGKAVNENDPGVTHAKASLWLRKLHDNMRWPDLVSKIGF